MSGPLPAPSTSETSRRSWSDYLDEESKLKPDAGDGLFGAG
jgi:hypothetical protein